MSGLTAGVSRFGGDDGSADPRVIAALADLAAGRGSEHAALLWLARSRLLVPIVAAAVGGRQASEIAAGEKASEMSVPTLIGADGRPAIPAFTCTDTLRRWRQEARQVPTEAAAVWQAAVADGCAVVIDVAGPVPVAIEGTRLAALAGGGPVPLPYQDPDVLTAVRSAAAGQAVAGLSLADGGADCDLVIRLTLAAGCGPAQAEQAAGVLATEVMARLGGRLRRGIAIELDAGTPPAGP
ncbi:MAG: SseB family protein [Streptosporangiaceae bacterium]